MKVLFVSSGNSKNFKVTPFIKAQGESISNQDIEVDYFSVKGKGFWGYINNAKKLRKVIRQGDFDVIHAHYTLSGWVALMSFSRKPLVLSLMGSDTYGEYVGLNKITLKSRYLILLTYLIQPFVNKIICKSEHIQSYVYLKKKSTVIPNGILFGQFKNLNINLYKELNLDPGFHYVLFFGDKSNIRKNYKLAKEAVEMLNNRKVKLLTPYPVSHNKMVRYLNIASVVVLPSFMEGSPNVVKEAMACDRPVVATDVGDVKWLFGNEPGYYIAGFTPENFAEKIEEAIAFSKAHKQTNGRDRLLELGLDSDSVAKRIINVYKSVKK